MKSYWPTPASEPCGCPWGSAIDPFDGDVINQCRHVECLECGATWCAEDDSRWCA